MRKCFLIVCFLLAGCSAVASVKSDLDACRGDVACSQRMEDARVASATATKAATQDGLLPSLAGYLVSLLVGVLGGHRLSKKVV